MFIPPKAQGSANGHQRAENMFISAVNLAILSQALMRIDSPLESTSSDHSRKLQFLVLYTTIFTGQTVYFKCIYVCLARKTLCCARADGL